MLIQYFLVCCMLNVDLCLLFVFLCSFSMALCEISAKKNYKDNPIMKDMVTE